jgi:hypothetical protein
MKEFEEALVCKCKNERIPEEFNYFGKVIGEWDLDWNDRLNTSTPRRVRRMDILMGTRRYGRTRRFHCPFKSRAAH